MKKIVSILVIAAMLFAVTPAVFASDVGTSEATAEPITDGTYTCTTPEGYFGYYYVYTPSENGYLTVSMVSEENYYVTVINTRTMDQQSLYIDDYWGNVYDSCVMEACAGDDIIINVIAADYSSTDLTFSVSFEQSDDVEYFVSLEANPDPMCLPCETVTIPAGGSVKYRITDGLGGGLLTIAGETVSVSIEGDTLVPEDGIITIDFADYEGTAEMGWMGVTYHYDLYITNNSSADTTYTIGYDYPLGHYVNPHVVEAGVTYNVTTPAEDVYGNFYHMEFVAPENCLVTVTVEGDCDWAYSISNYDISSYGDTCAKAYGAPNSASVIAYEGNTVSIFLTTDDGMYGVPGGTMDVTVTYEAIDLYPGSAYDPLTIGTYGCPKTVTVPAGVELRVRASSFDGIYFVVNGEGAYLTSVDSEYNVTADSVTYEAEDGVIQIAVEDSPAYFLLGSNSDEDVTYTIDCAYPVGHQNNPAALELDHQYQMDRVYDAGSYYLSWTAPADGELTFTMQSADGWKYAIHDSSYDVSYYHTSLDEEVVSSVTFEVTEGTVYTFEVSTYDGSYYGSPEGTLEFIATAETAEPSEPSNELVLGTNEVGMAGGDPDGETWTYTATESGALNITVSDLYVLIDGEWSEYDAATALSRGSYVLYINGELVKTCATTVMVEAGDVISIQMFGMSAMESVAKITLSMATILDLKLGENIVELKPYDYDGEIMHFVATEDGTLMIDITGMTYFDDIELYTTYVSKEEVIFALEQRLLTLVVNGKAVNSLPVSVDVAAGDVVSLQFSSAYGMNYTATFNLYMYDDNGTDTNPADATYSESLDCYIMNVDLPEGTSEYWWNFTVDHDGILSIQNTAYDAEYNVITEGFEVIVWIGDMAYYNWDYDVYSNPIITWPVSEGDEVTVLVITDGSYTKTYINATITDATEDSPVELKGAANQVVPVAGGSSVTVIDASNAGIWSGVGLEISGYDVSDTVVSIYDNEGNLVGTYTDTDGDGIIELTTFGGYSARGNIVIENNGIDMTYVLTVVDSAAESDEGCQHADIIHFDAVEPGCHYIGNIEYWYCPDCEGFWQDEALTQLTNSKNVILPATGKGNVVHVEAVEPGCHYEGSIEYWVCFECEQVWQDAALTELTNIKNVVVPAVGGEVEHFDAVEPGCHYDGNIEYWVCYECEHVWQDAALTQLTNIKNVVLPALGGDVIHVEAKDATCYEDGNIEYWYCEECEQVWQNEALTQLTNIKNVVLPATDHNIIHFDAVEPGCHYNGNIEYWFCSNCEGFWQDEALTQLTNSKNVILPATGGEVEHFEAVAPGCHYDGNIEYWVCYDCQQVWQDEALTQLTNIKNVVLPATGGEVEHFEAVEPGCHYDGNIEYWVCYDCEQVWQDEALTQLTNIKNVVVPAVGGEVVHVEAVEPGCHYDGNIEYWVCYDCEQVWQDEALTQLTNIKNVVLPAVGGDVIHVEAKDATCYEDGNIEYWYCEECEQVWQNEALTQLTNIKNVVLGALEHANLIHFEAVEPGCHYNGNIEYWFCPDCEGWWQDEALTQLTNSKNVVLPAIGGEVEHFEAVAPGCHYDGNIEYWVCYDCEQVWQDEALTQLTNIKNVVVPAVGGEVVHFEAVAPGCHYDGNIEYWVCYDCEQVWQDEALTQLTNIKNVVVPAVGGDVIHVEAVAPTCTENGNIEYWYCEECEQVWQDETLTQLTNIKNVVAPAAGHIDADVNGSCDNCGADLTGGNADTGDTISIAVAAAVISVLSIVALPVAKKKFF